MERLNEMMKLLLEVKAIQNEKGELLKVMATTLGEMRADMKTNITMASSPSDVTPPVPHTPSTTPSTSSPTIHQPSHISVSTQTTYPVVQDCDCDCDLACGHLLSPSHTSVSIQTEPPSEIFKIPIPISTYTPPPPVVESLPPPTSSLGIIITPPSPLLPAPSLSCVSAPISESLSGSTTSPRLQASSNRLATLRPQPYPPSWLRPEPEPPP